MFSRKGMPLPQKVNGLLTWYGNTKGGYCFALWSNHLGLSAITFLLYISVAINVRPSKLITCLMFKKYI